MTPGAAMTPGAEVVVVGAGIVGAAVARALALAGVGVTVLDRGPAACGTSASGEGNILVSDKAPGPELELARHSAGLWPALAAELTEELGPRFPALEYEPKGGLVVATTAEGAAGLTGFAAAQRDAGVLATELSADQALALEPWLTPDPAAVVHYPEDAQIQPVVATEALLASARLHGARLRVGCEVLGPVVARGRLVGLRTTGGDIAADQVVVAAGPWSGEVAARLGVDLPVLPRRGVVLVTARMPQRVFHKVYDADYVGAVASGAEDLQTSGVVESTPAGTVLIGSSREHVGFDATLRVRVLRELAARALRLFPFLADVPVQRAYGGFRPYTPDHLPVIGPDPRLPGLWHATGHEGAGIGLSAATAELLRDLLLDRTPTLAATPFAVDRYVLTSTAPPTAAGTEHG
ncbi:NAD(P)/FAD-dependent oxidoreductase [Streptacidiphilus jiangxiensis]|uniref:Glycine/D-amino acid oxidase n=1 Tax=Streptacidiphilus jiangxiensis TaxID=235985 RepID=A0A1H7VPT2_STRJI|nr:FAD-dependent oxidoreductase [Streptacidiphilus jiangxiensis]SEM10807.1 Glycine/D-amino acid oxidase [Streptacidiphilus jiangxiensis]